MSLYCSCRGNPLIPVLSSLVQSTTPTAYISKVNILSNAQVASPGCTKSAQDLQIPPFGTVYISYSSVRHLPPLPLRGNPQPPSSFTHLDSSPYRETTIPSPISSPNGERSRPSHVFRLFFPDEETTPLSTPPFYTTTSPYPKVNSPPLNPYPPLTFIHTTIFIISFFFLILFLFISNLNLKSYPQSQL